MKVGFVGPFGDTNFGDYAMLVNAIYFLHPAESIVFTYKPGFLDVLQKQYLSDFHIQQVVAENQYRYTPQYGEHYSVEYDDTVLSSAEIFAFISNMETVRETVAQIDILYVCGGGYFNRVWSAKHRKGKLISIMSVILAAEEAGKPIFFGGNTYGPFDESEELFRGFFLSLHHARLATRDDVFSIDNLQRMGIRSPIYLLPDDLYFLDTRLKKIPSTLMKEQGENEYILLELYSSIEELKTLLPQIRNFVMVMKQRYHLTVLFVPLDKMYGGEKQADFLKQEIPELIFLGFDGLEYRRIEDIQHLVQDAKFVLCQRYHLFVLAMANNIPAMNILKDVCGDKRYYYSKTNGLLRQIFSNQDYDQGLFMTDHISTALEQIASGLYEIQTRQREFFNDKKELAERQMQDKKEQYFSELLEVDMIE
ncbi:MAG: polysaccharide pyruvyl transferase family protein [Lachnospiraceae bacterium]|nr:polysaccharide pyruvyl transferase family protein [Lachnospiraceae bacterium]